MTLVEVMAALVILGGSVTAMLVAQSTSLEQLTGSKRQLVAQNIARELIANWRITDEDLSLTSSGRANGFEGWQWRRSTQEVSVAKGITALQVVLDVAYDNPAGRGKTWVRTYKWLIRKDGK